jgi:hypothetical protein
MERGDAEAVGHPRRSRDALTSRPEIERLPAHVSWQESAQQSTSSPVLASKGPQHR